jgi:thiol-disulfide isomerase/thioredoxin
VEKREIELTMLRKAFPAQNFDPEFGSVAIAYAKKLKLTQAVRYLGLIRGEDTRRQFAQSVSEIAMAYDAPAAEKLLRAEVVQIGTDTRYDSLRELFGNVLIRTGKFTEAMGYIRGVYQRSKNPSAKLRSSYGVLLNRVGKHAEALAVLEKLLKADQADPMARAAFVRSFKVINPKKDEQLYLAQIDGDVLERSGKLEGAKMIDEPCPDFTVSDVNGKRVSLQDFKGKTIVIDFWATWCGPCKRSFPAMKLAVEKYRNNDKVAFLFIHTWEATANPLEDARNYLKANRYDFDLYMDTKDPVSKKNEAVAAFGVKGIPAKFIVDGKGRIRYRAGGFAEGDTAALAELSHMIDTTTATFVAKPE